MRSILSLALGLVLVAAIAPSVQARERTEPYRYGTAPLLPARCQAPAETTGGACFNVTAEDAFVTITVEDEIRGEVGATWRFERADGTHVSSGSFCTRIERLVVPGPAVDGAAARLVVTVTAPGFGSMFCEEEGTAYGTRGTIRASFSPVED